MTTIAIANQKGGVAKTTTAVTTAALLADAGYRVLAIDLDPQSNLTTGSGLYETDDGVCAILQQKGVLKDCVSHAERYDVLPASITLALCEQILTGQTASEWRLKEALVKGNAADNYDIVIIDTPPALGALTVNGLVAADYVVIPSMADLNAAKGISQLGHTIKMVAQYFNQNLKIAGVLLTRFDPRLNISKAIREMSVMIADKLNADVFNTYIRGSAQVAEAVYNAQNIIDYNAKSTVAQDYQSFVGELLAKTHIR